VPTDLQTTRLTLHAVDEAQARHISGRVAGPTDDWAPDYPFDGDLAGLSGFLRATEQYGEQRPFGYYQIIRSEDGLAIGGIGFKSPPQDGEVEVGYGLVPSARGHGYASEALTAALTVAFSHGVATVVAETTHDNIASQRTLIAAGFTLVGQGVELRRYQRKPR
jgi:RimJ/RimL family protein N-acetyltransferase